MHPQSASLRTTLLACTLGLCLAGAMSGCNIVGPAVLLIEGPPKIDAAYELPEKASVVIFIQDLSTPPIGRSTRLAIAQAAQQDLLRVGVVKTVIDASGAFEAASTETASRRMDIQTIGRSVGADIVIYATIDSFTLSSDGATYTPAANFRAKVIDTNKDEDARLWPADPRGFAVIAQPLQRPRKEPESRGEADKARSELAKLTGKTLAKLFYSHERWKPVGDR